MYVSRIYSWSERRAREESYLAPARHQGHGPQVAEGQSFVAQGSVHCIGGGHCVQTAAGYWRLHFCGWVRLRNAFVNSLVGNFIFVALR